MCSKTEKQTKILSMYIWYAINVLLGGKIDWAHHDGEAALALSETIAMADAVAIADKLTSDQDTLIVVTADHSHTMSIVGYPDRGNPILGIVCICRWNDIYNYKRGVSRAQSATFSHFINEI